MTPDHTAAIKELTERVRHFGKAAADLGHVVAGHAANEIAHPRRHAALSRLAGALRDCGLAVKHGIDAAPASIKQ